MSRLRECPLCFKYFHVSLLQSHAAECCGGVEVALKEKAGEHGDMSDLL